MIQTNRIILYPLTLALLLGLTGCSTSAQKENPTNPATTTDSSSASQYQEMCSQISKGGFAGRPKTDGMQRPTDMEMPEGMEIPDDRQAPQEFDPGNDDARQQFTDQLTNACADGTISSAEASELDILNETLGMPAGGQKTGGGFGGKRPSMMP